MPLSNNKNSFVGCVFLALSVGSGAASAAVERDLTYQSTGWSQVDFGSADQERSRGIAIDPTNGRAVLVGQVDLGGTQIGVIRLNTDGSPDNTFSGDGRILIQPCASATPFPSSKNVAVQPDGKIVVVATCTSPERIVVVRLLANGDYDNTFDVDGIALVPAATPAQGSRGLGLALQGDGKILVTGVMGLLVGTGRGVVVRLNANGTIDGGFASNGVHTTSVADSWLQVVRVMADGRIVAGGFASVLPAGGGARHYNLFLLRLDATGTPDAQFNGNGTLSHNIGGRTPVDPAVLTDDRINDIAVRPDGAIIVAGSTAPPSVIRIPILAQFTSAGALDTNWGTGGYVTPPGGGGGDAFSVALRPAGDLLTTGLAMDVTHVSPNGLDIASIAFVQEQGYDLALQEDGKFVAAVDLDALSSVFQASRYIATLPAPDTTPNGFSFDSVDNAALATLVSAETIIMGVSAPTEVSITGGEFSVGCTGTWTAAGSTDDISNAETVCVRHTSSGSSSTSVTSTLTIGGVVGTFTSTTGDAVPEAFSFVDQNSVGKSTVIVSAGITVSGITLPTPISVTGGEYSINCGPTYTSAAGTVTDGQAVCLRHTSSGMGSTGTTTTLTIGGVSDGFVTTTVADPPEKTWWRITRCIAAARAACRTGIRRRAPASPQLITIG